MTPTVFSDLTSDQLIELSLKNGEGEMAANGALNVNTGARTGRSPKDRYIIIDDLTRNAVDWGTLNQPYMANDFDRLWADACQSLEAHNTYESICWLGAHPAHRIAVKVRCNLAWHTLFCKTMLMNPSIKDDMYDWVLVNASNFRFEGSSYNLPRSAAVVIDFTHRRILICGTLYAGEMKKALFSVLNFIYPDQNILPMHCAANRTEHGNVALFFGLSGTGKTTLSADSQRQLIGDDEHGWGDDGVFNFEGGCYAKCIHLSAKNEPLIWAAIRHGTVLENVVLDPLTKIPNFSDASLTENTRAAYPLHFIPNQSNELVHPQPENIIFLTCDLYGVLPLVSKLTQEQVIYYFLSGYTALVGSTEVGQGQGIKPTFSQCFGAPFFSRHPKIYANLLLDKLRKTGAQAYLVNTGWHKGAYGEGGDRFPIQTTRQIISAIVNNSLKNIPLQETQPFGLFIPTHVPGVDSSLLDPKQGWKNFKEYESKAQDLINQFNKNYQVKGFDKSPVFGNLKPEPLI